MSTLKTLLTVANIGISAANYGRLQELQEEQGQAQSVAMLVQLAKDMLFNFKQAADDAIANGSVNPKLSTARLQMLNLGLSEMGITPQVFPDLADKEYAAITQKYITTNYEQLMAQLPAEEKREVQTAIQAVQQYQDAEYYLTHYDSVEDYQQAKPVYEQLSSRNGCLMTIGIILLFYPGMVVPSLLLALIGGSISNEPNGSLAILGGIVGFFIWLWFVILVFRWKRGKEYKKAKKIIDAFESTEVSIDKFEVAKRRLGVHDKTKVEELHKVAQIKIENFFGTKTAASLLP